MSSLVSYALTTVPDVKESMGVASSDNSYDNLIVLKINQATEQIEAYCGRRFLQTTYSEVYGATDVDQIVLNNRPIIGTPTVEIRDTSLNDDVFETVDSQLVFYDAKAGVLNLNFRAIGHWARFRITYTAGYATIPEDLAEAAASLAAYLTLNADGSRIGLLDMREGQRQIRFNPQNHLTTFQTIMGQLGIDSIIDSYANLPISTDV